MSSSKIDPRLTELRSRIATLVDGDHWKKSRFLTVIQKKFLRIIDGIDRSVAESGAQVVASTNENEELVYIPLFHRHGMSLSDWEGVMRSFESIAPTRHVFAEENLAVSYVSGGAEKCQNAYVELSVTQDEFLHSSSAVSQNIFQTRAVVLKPSAFRRENIRRFVHMGQSYSWTHGVLHKIID